MLKAYDAVVFDLDGTLVDSIADLADAMNASLAEHGLPPRTYADCKRFVGDGALMFTERAAPRAAHDPKLAESILEGFKKHYSACWAVKTAPYEGIAELLDALVARGLKLTVLSNKIEAFTAQMVAETLKRWTFAVVRGERVGVPRKPDPAGAIEIAQALGTLPGRCLYLGDTSTDMKTAVGAGMVPVGVLWGFREAAELTASGAVHLLKHPLDLIPILEAASPPAPAA